MNLQQLIRAAVCAALVVVCFAGVSGLRSQPVNGQQLGSGIPGNSPRGRQIYRAGLRNSFLGHPLNAKEMELVLTQLRDKTGFVQMRFDEAGFLTIEDRSQIAGGSAAARELLLAAVDGKKSINLQSHNQSPNVAFGRAAEGVNYGDWRSKLQITAVPVELDFSDFNHLRGERKVLEAFDIGFVLLHELCHAALELRDPLAQPDTAGDCESYVNRIRRELDMPERQQYRARARLNKITLSIPTVQIAELVFVQADPESRAKKKRFYLRWNTEQVGDGRRSSPTRVKEKPGSELASR